MFRLSGIVSVLLAVFCGAMLFWTSQSVQRAEQRLSEVSREAQNEEETLRVLTAEWDYLNRPERLEALTNGNLDLDAPMVDGKSIIESADQIPQPVVPVIPKVKPANLLQYVSTQKKSAEKNEPAVIEKNDSQDFDKLLNNMATGAGQ